MSSHRRTLFAVAVTLTAAATFGCQDPAEPEPPKADEAVTATADGPPRTVSNLQVVWIRPNSFKLSFTEVDDGTGNPAKYDIRYARGTISWGSASSVTFGTCQSQQTTSKGAGQSFYCSIEGIPSTSDPYQFQVVAYRGTLNQDAVFGQLSNVASNQGAPSGRPGAVTDLRVSSAYSNAVYLKFTSTDDGNRGVANYEVRFAPSPISWGSASRSPGNNGAGSSNASCKNLKGEESQGPGWLTTCFVVGLSPGVHYDFQLVPYSGTLNQNAVFGPLSNIASTTTATSETAIGPVQFMGTLPGQATNPRTEMIVKFGAPTQPSSGQPLRYDVRFKQGTMSWGSAASASQGTCADLAAPYPNLDASNAVYCVVAGLSPGSSYEFQLVPYRGTLNKDAVFGPLSPVVQGTTNP